LNQSQPQLKKKQNHKAMVIVKKNIKDSTRPIYYKAVIASEVKVADDGRTVSGYAAIWGNVDDAGDMLIKGCCAKSITERGPGSNTNRKIIFLWMHDTEDPLGRITKLVEDDKGLYFEAEVDKIPQGDRCIEQLSSGTLNQFSIGYMYVWDKCEWDSAREAFIVKEINLFEISVVSFGCNEETGFEGMKSGQLESERNKLIRDTDKALKSLPYEDQIKIRQLISKHIALNEVKPGRPLDDQEPQEESQLTGN
jgi:HK97 family phage prohead protease